MWRVVSVWCLLVAAPVLAAAELPPRAPEEPPRAPEEPPRNPRPSVAPEQNELWLLDTRQLSHGEIVSSRRALPQMERYETAGGWRASSLAELESACQRRVNTVLLVHGNDTDDGRARSKGLAVYEALSRRQSGPFRLLVWSWPADYIPGTLRQDARIKAERAEADAYYLAQFVNELRCDPPVVLVGYSLGSRIVAGALHLLGGGTLGGRAIRSAADRPRGSLRAVLMAAAINDDWLLPGHRFGRALSAVERMVVLVNPQDRVLRWYRFLSPRNGAAALGVRGIASLAGLGAQRTKLEQVNVNAFVGGQHAWSTYVASPGIVDQLRREIFIHPSESSPKAIMVGSPSASH